MGDTRLQELSESLREGDIQTAVTLQDETETALGEQATRERALRTLARGIAARTEASDQASQAAMQLLDAANDAQSKRLEHTVEWFAFTEGDLPAETFAASVETLIEAHETVTQRGEELHDHKHNVPLPVLTALFGPEQLTVPKGTSFEFTHTLENIGSLTATDIDVDIGTIEDRDKAAFDLDVEPESIDELAGGTSTDLTITGTATEARRVTVQVDIAGNETSGTETTIVDVLDKRGYLQRALEAVAELDERIRERTATDGGRGRGGLQGVLNKLDTAKRRLNNLLADLDDENGNGPPIDSIDNRTEALIGLLESVRNQLSGLAGSQLSERQAGSLSLHTGDIIDRLESAVDADV